MRSIRTKLTLIIIATSILAVALVGVTARWITHTQFNTFRLEQTRSAFIDAATAYYQQHGSWDGAETALEEEINRILGVPGGLGHPHPPSGGAAVPQGGTSGPGADSPLPSPPSAPAGAAAALRASVSGRDSPSQAAPDTPPDRTWNGPAPAPRAAAAPAPWPNDRFERRNPFALANLQGVAVIGNHRWHQGATIPNRVLAGGTPVTLDGERIGTVTYDAPPELRTLERLYLARTGQAILYAAIAAFALALVVGVVATRFFTRPIRDLTGAIRKMRAGELEQTVPTRSNDEFGEMARSQRLREQMTADIAHDLRTPLTVLTGYLESIRDGVLDATPDAVDTMYEEATQLQRLVEDLRTLSLADAGRLSLQRETVDAAELLRSARQSFAPMADQAGVRLEVEVEDPAPELDVDPSRMRQVLGNLIGNALRHTSRGGRVRLRARREDGGVALVVEDDGEGIAPEVLPRIFERFYRADPARSPAGGGSGLGLPIARSLVMAHGGSIRAESRPGQGTVITVHLPRHAT